MQSVRDRCVMLSFICLWCDLCVNLDVEKSQTENVCLCVNKDEDGKHMEKCTKCDRSALASECWRETSMRRVGLCAATEKERNATP